MDAPTTPVKRSTRSRTNDPDRTKADILAVATEEYLVRKEPDTLSELRFRQP